MKKLISTIIATALPLFGQCQPGNHPAGITSGWNAALTSGCNLINSDPVPFFSMSAPVSEAGGIWRFTWLNPPHTGNLPATGVGLVALSTNVAIPGVQVPSTTPGCSWHVPLDLLLNPLVPFVVGCQSTFAFVQPPIPGLAGFVFYAQGGALDLTSGQWFISRAIRVTVQP